MEKKPDNGMPFSTKSLSFGRQRPSSAKLPRFLFAEAAKSIANGCGCIEGRCRTNEAKAADPLLRVRARTTNSNRCSIVPLNTTSTTTNFVELGALYERNRGKEVRETGLVPANPSPIFT
jgi:hypothetical protein